MAGSEQLIWVLLGVLALAVAGFGMVRRTKTRPENLPKHEARGRILRELERDPGARLQELCDRLGLPRGTARYHLDLLERSGILSSLKESGRHHYFPPEATPQEVRSLTVLRRGRAPEILAAVLRQPGIMQRDLLRRIQMHRKVFKSYRRDLVQEELLVELRENRTRHYHATPKLLEFLDRWMPPEELHPARPGLRPPRLGGDPPRRKP